MELLHLSGDSILGFIVQLLDGCLQGQLSHDHANNINFWCTPLFIKLTDISAIHMASLLFFRLATIYVSATAYLFPFMLGMYFSSCFLSLMLHTAISFLGNAACATTGTAGTVVGSAVGMSKRLLESAVQGHQSCCALLGHSLGLYCPSPLLWAQQQSLGPLL